MLQCGRYALEILSSAGFRTHCLGALVVGGRIQLLYYDRSIIMVCKPIDMFRSVEASQSTTTITTDTTVITDEFGAMLVAFHRLTLKQRGIQEQLCVDRALIENYKTYTERCGKVGGDFDQRDIFQGVKLSLKLQLGEGDEEIDVEVTLGRIISRQPAIIGRHTCVVEAKSDYKGWKGKELIIKISWPAVQRKSEADLVKIAREKARTMKTGKKPDWALDHLPDILLCQDFDYGAGSTQANITALFEKAEWAEKETHGYEHRVCRITVQEKLHALEELRTVEEYAQVFFDILQIHKWLYDHPRILHRDISPGNIMWRRTVDGRIRGVLNDFDLSSLRSATGASSTQRTGTLPYMAYELLSSDENGQPPKHLYRHDVESVFYVILLLLCRYKFVGTHSSSQEARRKVASPFDHWYTLTRAQLKTEKGDFWLRGVSPMVNSGFHDFQTWVDHLCLPFILGFSAQTTHRVLKRHGKTAETFDSETLGDRISYSVIVDICGQFAGSALVVRNDQLEEGA
ncbi:hypothetical protein IW261DRAFT_188242 [Armillaria novae-zelandiae]|uniref:Protein kinase domain-containing protein n=1 Tax=Armillaria novae-zelandiae TaxID=153914 RepID=A0AA39P7Q3_9AGAR|nr:hypothetical protein IW261DRAFT_188242 [Armillaria novae-zelandiae]